MSAEMDSFTEMDTIFVQLLHEGTFCDEAYERSSDLWEQIRNHRYS